MKLTDLIKKGVETISELYPEVEAKEMVFAYFDDVFGFKRHTHILEPELEIPGQDVVKVLGDFARMAVGEPLQYVTGKAFFYGREFRVSPDVLIPRQETELLIGSLLSSLPPKTLAFPAVRHPLAGGGMSSPSFAENNDQQTKTPVRILDLCTGSGCIAWTLALEIPSSEVTAVDISEGALGVASRQDFTEEYARTGALPPLFVNADVLKGPQPFIEAYGDGKFNIIVSNPPYVMDKEKALMRMNVLDHEPHLALFVPDDDPLVFYRAVAGWAMELLADDGIGIVEINEALGEDTAQVFRDCGFSQVAVVKDLHEKDRFVKFIKK